jgi:hypothetical protein
MMISQRATADATWTGASSQSWNDGTNWTLNPPTGNFFINTATGNFPIISANSAFTPTDLIIADGGANSGRLDQTAGSLSLANVTTSGNWFFVARGSNTATGIFNLANTAAVGVGITGYGQGSGSLTVGKFFVGGGYFNNGGIGTANINTTGVLNIN